MKMKKAITRFITGILVVAGILVLAIRCTYKNREGVIGKQEASEDEPVNDELSNDDFSKEIMFTIYSGAAWDYVYYKYTVLYDGTLIISHYDKELGRNKIDEEKFTQLKEYFSPAKIASLKTGPEGEMTDGSSKYIVLYDAQGEQIPIGGYELSSKSFSETYTKLWSFIDSDYTMAWTYLGWAFEFNHDLRNTTMDLTYCHHVFWELTKPQYTEEYEHMSLEERAVMYQELLDKLAEEGDEEYPDLMIRKSTIKHEEKNQCFSFMITKGLYGKIYYM